MSDSKSSAEWQEEANRLNYVILDGRRERDELAAQLAESERKRDIAYSALATDEAERKRLEGLCEQLSTELEQQRKAAAQELAAVTLERDEWKGGTEYAQQQATELRMLVEALERQARIAQGTIDEWRDAWERATGVGEQYKRQVSDLQAQLDAAAVTPAQTQPEPGERLVKLVVTSQTVEQQLREVEAERDNLREQVLELQAQLEAATPDGSRSWQCELTEAQTRLEAALESWRLTKEDLATTQAVRLKLEARLSSYHKHEQELRDILGWARSYQRCGLTIQPSRLVQLMQKITLHDGTAKLFFEEGK